MGTKREGSVASQLPCTFFVQRPIRLSPLTPSESQAIAHSPHVCHWASLLGSFTELETGCFQVLVRKKKSQETKWYTSSSMTSYHPRPLDMKQWFWQTGGKRGSDDGGDERGEKRGGHAGKGWAIRPDFQARLPHCKLPHLPKPWFFHVWNGEPQHLPWRLIMRISNNLCKTHNIKWKLNIL